jgi:hypothetical protein
MGNTEIRLNPDKVQAIITDLTNFRNQKVGPATTKVTEANEDVSSPCDLGSFKSNAASHSENLRSKIADLQTCLDAAKAANDCGITTKKSDGTIAYIVAEGHAESIENIKADNHVNEWQSAQKDAKALSEALNNTSSNASGGGVSSDGRTIEQILNDMSANADNPYYGSTFVKKWSDEHGGFEDFLRLPISAQMAYTEYDTNQSPPRAKSTNDEAVERFNGVLGRVLAAATHTSTVPEGYSTWAEAVCATVQKEGQRGLVSSANQLLAAPDAVYDTDFLVDLAAQFEKFPYDGDPASKTPDSIWGYYDHEYGAFYNEGRAFSGGSMDPMYGVLSAMKNNSYAAIRYLVPDGSTNSDGQWIPGKATLDRWDRLTSRNWDSEVGLDAFTAAQASASSYLGSDKKNLSEPAIWLTRNSIAYAVDQLKVDQYTDNMKSNLSVLIANSPGALISVADGGYPEGLKFQGGRKAAGDMYSSLVYRVMDNQDAAATIAAAVANHAAATHPGDTNAKFEEAARGLSFIYALGEKKVEKQKEHDAEEAKNTQATVDAVTSLGLSIIGSTVIGPAGPAASLVWESGTTLAKPMLFSDVAPEAKADLGEGSMLRDGEEAKAAYAREMLQTQAYVELANANKLPDTAMKPEHFIDGDTHKPYKWYHPNDQGNPPISLSDYPNGDESVEVHQWVKHARDMNALEGGTVNTQVFSETDTKINTGFSNGTARAKSVTVK